MIKKIDLYLLVEILFILAALSFIVFVRTGYYQPDRHDPDAFLKYFTPLTFDYIVMKLLSFGVLFAACFDLKAALKRRLQLKKKRFIFSLVLLLISLVDFYNFMFNQALFENFYNKLIEINWITPGTLVVWSHYSISMQYLTLVTSALAGYLSGTSFKRTE